MKISLITVAYNSEETLLDTLKSVSTQTYSDFEYIIIDGASNDMTLDIVKENAYLFDNRLRWLSEEDGGLYDAMNKGIQMATGEVVGIINSDDFFTSNDVLEKIAEAFRQDDLDAIYGDVHFVRPENINLCIRYYSSRLFSRKWMRLGFMPAHPSFYLRKECFDRFGLYKTDYKIAADFEFLLRTIFIGRIRTKYLSLDMVTMRTGGASTSGISSHIQIMKEHVRAFRENSVYTNVFLLSLRYLYKMGELLYNRISSSTFFTSSRNGSSRR